MQKYELLYLAEDRSHEAGDPAFTYQKGYPVVYKEGGWQWGKKECLPSFIRVEVFGTEEQISSLFGGWNRRTTYNITAFDPMTDTFKIDIFADPATIGKNDEGVLTVEAMQEFLTKWGAIIKHEECGKNSIVFSLSALDVLEGKGYIYFDKEDEYVIFTEEAYDPASGLHRINADYSNSVLTIKQVEETLVGAKATLLSIDHDKGLFSFETTRDIMKAHLEEDVRQNFDTQVCITTYHLPEEYVDTVIANGGIVEESDFETFKAKLLSKRE